MYLHSSTRPPKRTFPRRVSQVATGESGLVIGATRAAWAGELDGANSKAKYAICERIEKWVGVPLLDHGHGWSRHYNLFWMRFDKSRTVP